MKKFKLTLEFDGLKAVCEVDENIVFISRTQHNVDALHQMVDHLRAKIDNKREKMHLVKHSDAFIEFAKFAKNYQSDNSVERAWEQWLER